VKKGEKLLGKESGRKEETVGRTGGAIRRRKGKGVSPPKRGLGKQTTKEEGPFDKEAIE